MKKHKEFVDKLNKHHTQSFDPSDAQRFRHLLYIVSEYQSKCKVERMLDVGCGDGRFSAKLKDATGIQQIYGIELSTKRATIAKKNGVEVVQLDIDESDFPFCDNCFDVIFAGEVIEHLFDPDHFLDECRRVLKKNGIFILTTRNLSSFYNRITLLMGYQPFSTSVSVRHNVGRPFELNDEILGDHIRVFTFRALVELLRLSKFEIVKVIGSPSVLPEKGGLLVSSIKLFDKLLSLFPSLSQGIVVVCKKIGHMR